MSTRLLFATFVFLSLSFASTAAADAVPPEPTDCPAGSIGSTCHGGPFCRPDTCDTANDCDAGFICEDTQACISTIDCGGIGGPAPTDAYEGPCGSGDSCTDGTCQPIKICLPEGGATAVSSGATTSSGAGASSSTGGSGGEGGNGEGTTRVDQGCGCEVVGARSSGPWWLLFGAALPLWRRRRRP
ncbi:MAG: MYXO-CTERM sorting domain-containing protein [Polyangiaceae bacterium]